MNQNPQVQQLLAQLNDLVVIDAVDIWPLAPGWWILGLLLITLLALLIVYGIVRYRRNRYRRLALKHLKSLADIEAPDKYLIEISSLLKRTAIAAYPYEKYDIIALFGEAWTDWLYRRVPRAPLNNEAKDALAHGLYQKALSCSRADLHNFAFVWIKRHKRHTKRVSMEDVYV